MSTQDNEKNKRLHETIADLGQPVSLADELRKLVERWRELARKDEEDAADYNKRLGLGEIITVTNGRFKDLREVCSDELSALLAQHAVAEPQRVLTEHQRKVEEAAGMPIDWGMANASTVAHAVEQPKFRVTEEQVRLAAETFKQDYFGMAQTLSAIARPEQPKLTAEQIRSFFLQHNIVVWERPASWHCHCSRWALDSKLNDELVMRKSWAEHCVEEFAALLTSPVAPPPPRNDKREGAERTARLLCETRGHTGRRPCDFCQMQIDACLRETEPLRTCYCGTPKEPHCESVHAPPPVAPGEQPPQLIGQPLPVPASHGTQFGSDYQPLNAPEVMSAPLAQERPEDK